MSSVRLLVAAAILSSTWVCAQDHAPNPSQLPANSKPDSISRTGRWRIDQLGPTSTTVSQSPFLSFHTPEPPAPGEDQVLQMKALDAVHAQEAGNMAIPADALADHYCLKIRSYLVARDSKNSDSTHLVGYSTCLPASRYRLRTAVGSTQIESSP